MEQLQNLIDPVSSFLWGWLLIYVLLATGLYFSIRTRLVQFGVTGGKLRYDLIGIPGSTRIAPFPE